LAHWEVGFLPYPLYYDEKDGRTRSILTTLGLSASPIIAPLCRSRAIRATGSASLRLARFLFRSLACRERPARLKKSCAPYKVNIKRKNPPISAQTKLGLRHRLNCKDTRTMLLQTKPTARPHATFEFSTIGLLIPLKQMRKRLLRKIKAQQKDNGF